MPDYPVAPRPGEFCIGEPPLELLLLFAIVDPITAGSLLILFAAYPEVWLLPYRPVG